MRKKSTVGIPLNKNSITIIKVIAAVFAVLAIVIITYLSFIMLKFGAKPIAPEDYSKKFPLHKEFECAEFVKILDVPLSLQFAFLKPGPDSTFIVGGLNESKRVVSYTVNTEGNIVSSNILPENIDLEDYLLQVNYVPLVNPRSGKELSLSYENTYTDYNNFPNGKSTYISNVTMKIEGQKCSSKYYLIKEIIPLNQNQSVVLFNLDNFSYNSAVYAIVQEKL